MQAEQSGCEPGGRELPSVEILRQWALELGFASFGVADVDLSDVEDGFQAWLDAGYHGEMDYMARHGMKRARAPELVEGTVRALMVSIEYAPDDPAWVERAWATLADGEQAYVSRYALGRDYHKLVRSRLQRLAGRIEQQIGPFGYRVFCDSAPVMEGELARRAGLGWRGKHTLVLNPRRGSTFFLGTIYTDLELPVSGRIDDHCGTCVRCIDACPTGAIIAPYRLDARRCISYLTIEHKGPIPEELRPLMGNRIYGCDDCQLACPWNRFARPTAVADFHPRQKLDHSTLVELFAWSAEEFDSRLAGSPIRRIGHERWLRNLAVAMGNSAGGDDIVAALRARRDDASPLVREHVEWALRRLAETAGALGPDGRPAARSAGADSVVRQVNTALDPGSGDNSS